MRCVIKVREGQGARSVWGLSRRFRPVPASRRHAAGLPGGHAAVRGAEFRSPGAPDTPETQESMMECVCEHSLRHGVERGMSVQTQVQACASVRAGCRPAEVGGRGVPACPSVPLAHTGLPPSTHVACSGSLAQGPWWSACIRLGGDSGRPCPPSTPSRTTGGTLLAITSGSRPLARAEGGCSSQA